MRNDKLAIHGGRPVREEPIYYGKQYIDDEDIKAVEEVLRGPLITCGPMVEQLEKSFCDLTGAKFAVAMANGTAALHASCFAAKIGKGDEVITSPMTFAASANVALYVGAKPVFADINPETYNISPQEIRKNITPNTKAIIVVDFTGQAAELEEIREICEEFNLCFIEDAAHALGTKYRGIHVGNIADMTTFSFHPVKTITGGEGGMVLTNHQEYYQRLLLFRTHGITRDVNQFNNRPEGNWYYEQIDLGYNARLTDIQAALLVSQLKKLERFSNRRKEIVRKYNSVFSKMPEIIIQKEIPESDSTKHLYVLNLNLDLIKASRKEIFNALYAENICCNVHYIPVYYFPYYEKLAYAKGLCPNAERLYDSIISIPLYYSMTDQDVDDVICAIKKVVGYYQGE